MRQLLLKHTRPGDLVFDACGCTGVLSAVAIEHDRRLGLRRVERGELSAGHGPHCPSVRPRVCIDARGRVSGSFPFPGTFINACAAGTSQLAAPLKDFCYQNNARHQVCIAADVAFFLFHSQARLSGQVFGVMGPPSRARRLAKKAVIRPECGRKSTTSWTNFSRVDSKHASDGEQRPAVGVLRVERGELSAWRGPDSARSHVVLAVG